MGPQITSITIVYSTVYSGANQRKHQSSTSLAFVWGIHRWPVDSPHKGPVTRKMFPFDDVIMKNIWFDTNIIQIDNYREICSYLLHQICNKLSCGWSKVHGWTNTQTDRRTDADNDNTPLTWRAKGLKGNSHLKCDMTTIFSCNINKVCM